MPKELIKILLHLVAAGTAAGEVRMMHLRSGSVDAATAVNGMQFGKAGA